jgi:hypothetical protein
VGRIAYHDESEPLELHVAGADLASTRDNPLESPIREAGAYQTSEGAAPSQSLAAA